MADLFGGGGGGGGGGDVFPLEQWFYETPVCTRYWTTFTVIISVLVQCHVLSPFQLFYSFRAVYFKNEVRSSPLRSLLILTALYSIGVFLPHSSTSDHSPLSFSFTHFS